MNEVKEIISNYPSSDMQTGNPNPNALMEWSLIAVLFAFLVREIWTHFKKKLVADQKLLDSLVTHLHESNDKLIEYLEPEELQKKD